MSANENEIQAIGCAVWIVWTLVIFAAGICFGAYVQ